MRIKLQQIALALLLLAGSPGAGHAEAAERPAPSGGDTVAAAASPQTTDHSIVVPGRTLDIRQKPARCRCCPARATSRPKCFMSPTRCSRRHRRRAASAASHHIRLQRRSGSGFRLSAISARSVHASSRRLPMEVFAPAAEAHRQSGHLARHDRPGVRRPGRNRLQPRSARPGNAQLLGRRSGRQRDGRFHPALSRAGGPHRIAGVSGRGKLWRVPGRAACQDAAGRCRHQPERHRAHLAGAGIHARASRRVRAAALGAGAALARGRAPASEGVGGPALRERLPRSKTMRLATISWRLPAGSSKVGGWRASAWRKSRACRSTSSNETLRVSPRRCSPRNSRAREAMC